MNGDLDEANFTFYPAVAGMGCIAPWTIPGATTMRILFLSSCGVYSYDLAQTVLLSSAIQDDLDDIAVSTRAEFFVAGVQPCDRQYQLSVTPSGGTTNTKTHALNLGADVWGRIERGMGVNVPTCYSDTSDCGPIHNSAGRVKLYVGDTGGYLYETDSTASVGDGVTSGTVAGSVTSRRGHRRRAARHRSGRPATGSRASP